MPEWSVAWTQGMGLYLLLCAVAVLTGRGLLWALRLRVGGRAGLVLAPLLTFLFWNLFLGITTGLRLPVKQAAPWLWGATLALAVPGWRGSWSAVRSAGWPLLVCTALPMVLMASAFRVGLTQYSGTLAGDGQVYVAGGQYYWECARGTTEGLAVLHQLGAAFKDHRYQSFSLLGFFSPLVNPGDTLAVAGLFQAWTLFSLACAVFLFWVSEAETTWLAGAATALTVLSGWITDTIWGNFFDQGLALVYVPALASVPAFWGPTDPRRWLLLGGLLAGLTYTYPVCLPFALGTVLLLALPWFWRERRPWRAWLCGGGAAVALAALLLGPGVACLQAHLRDMYHLAVVLGGKLGFELFAGLLNPHGQPAAFWALGNESHRLGPGTAAAVLGIVLSVLLLLGLVTLLRQGRWGLAATVLALVPVAAYFLWWRRHPYAVFKILTLNWWCVTGAVVLGARWAVRQAPHPWGRRWLATGLLLAALLASYWGTRMKYPFAGSRYQSLPRDDFRRVVAIQALVGKHSVLLAAHDWLANYLAVYHLRDLPLDLAARRNWLEGIDFAPSRKPPPFRARDPVQYVLTDKGPEGWSSRGHGGKLMWSAGPYCLWKFDCGRSGAALVSIDNRNGIDRDGQTYRFGAGDTTFFVLAREEGLFHLVTHFETAPRLAESSRWQILVTTPGGYCRVLPVARGERELSLPVQAGLNRMVWRPLTTPPPPPGDGECRLPLSISGMKTSFTAASWHSRNQE
jgi:hypothetical protein